MHTHQDALAIDTLMEMITGIKLETDPTYLRKRPKSGIDDLIGFNANCIKTVSYTHLTLPTIQPV